jgi:hypothetical protein
MAVSWVRSDAHIFQELQQMRGDKSLSLTIGELMIRIGADEEKPIYRDRDAWIKIQRGDADWDGARRAGLVVNFWPDESGRAVDRVTYRIDEFQRRG